MSDVDTAARRRSSAQRPRARYAFVRRPTLLWAVSACGLLAALTTWKLTVALNDLPRVVLPTPFEVVRRLARLFGTSGFWHDVGTSLYEFGWGFVIGSICGVLVGVLMSESARVGMILHPVIEILRFVVPFAWIPLVVLWFGTSVWGKVFLVAYAVFCIMVISTAAMIRDVDATLSRVGVMLGMGRSAMAIRVRLRAAAPGVASSARAAAAIGWIAVVAAEYIGSNAGVGFLIINAQQALATDVIIGGMIVIGLIGAGLSLLIGLISKTFFKYD